MRLASNFSTSPYWHWTFSQGVLPDNNYNVYISEHSGSDGRRNYYNFRAFESESDYGHTDPTGAYDSDCFYVWRDDPQDGSWWWFRFIVNHQSYTDYEKMFNFRRVVESLESAIEVNESNTITNIQHWVKYRQ